MYTVSLFDTKTHLSRIISDLTEGKEKEVCILRHGKPVAKLTPIKCADTSRRIGCAEGKFTVPEDIDKDNKKIEKLFTGGGDVNAHSA